jgi:membrane-bound lytic murein transglycosylase D
MKTQNPLSPLSGLPQPARGKSNVHIAVITIAVLHAVFFGGLLLQGCKPEASQQASLAQDTNRLDLDFPFPEEPVVTSNTWPDFSPPTDPGTTSTGDLETLWPPADPNANVGVDPSFGAPSDPGLTTPSAPIVPIEPIEPAYEEYTIVAGDTLYEIALSRGLPLQELQDANPGADPRRLAVGQVIKIPAVTSSTTRPPLEDGSPPLGSDLQPSEIYVVKPGDSLWKISRRYEGVTVPEIRAANNLKSDTIKPGQKLRIPTEQE